jgi:hypothetical protein
VALGCGSNSGKQAGAGDGDAYGKTWANQAGATALDSTQRSPGGLPTSVSCTSGIDLGGENIHTNDASIGTADCPH